MHRVGPSETERCLRLEGILTVSQCPIIQLVKAWKIFNFFECLDNSELFIENVCMYNVSFFFPLSMYFFWSCWGRLYGQHEPLLCHTFLFPERY